jgi:Flp pilus assembly protein TadG
MRDEHGSATLEAVLVVPLFVLLCFFAIFGGRLMGAKNHVVGAAQDAARSASLRDDPASARAAATSTADASLRAAGLACSSRDINVDTGDLRPGGVVRVRVSCVADLSDLMLLGVPGAKTLSASATETIDTFRSTP